MSVPESRILGVGGIHIILILLLREHKNARDLILKIGKKVRGWVKKPYGHFR